MSDTFQDDESREIRPPIEVPADSLDKEVLNAVIESFIQREGTDYGAVEVELDTKIIQIQKQLQKGHIKIVFDPNTESVTLMTKHEFNKHFSPC